MSDQTWPLPALTLSYISYLTLHLFSPIERVVSAYFYCRRLKKDQLCASRVLDASSTDLLTFAKHWGNYGLRQVSFCEGSGHHRKGRRPHLYLRPPPHTYLLSLSLSLTYFSDFFFAGQRFGAVRAKNERAELRRGAFNLSVRLFTIVDVFLPSCHLSKSLKGNPTLQSHDPTNIFLRQL